jgi:hypothetical protein
LPDAIITITIIGPAVQVVPTAGAKAEGLKVKVELIMDFAGLTSRER